MKSSCIELRIKDETELKYTIAKKRDEFLDVYSFYKKAGVAWIRDELALKAYELHLLDPSFKFHI